MENKNIRKNVRKDEQAVSPVIGVILMVAITVILAAVIGAFVFGMGPSESAPNINFRATSNSTGWIVVDVMGGDNVSCGALDFKVNSATPTVGATAGGYDTGDYTTAGRRIVLENAHSSGQCTVTVIDKATNTVILQSKVSVL